MYVEFEKKYQYNQEDVVIINYLSDISGTISGISLVGWDEDFVSNTTKMLKDNFVRFELWLVSKKDCDFLQLMELETMKSFERDSSEFLKENYFAHSGMDIEKGHYNRLDGFYMEVERWYETYLEKRKKALQYEIEIMENVSMDLDKRIKADADLFEKYQGINIDALVEGYDQYEALYNGEWIQLGSYPEEGQYNPNPMEREQALNILRGLYDKIKPYEQQIKADMEYLEGNLMAYPHIKEKISCMANICRDYHDRIEFIENLNKSSKQDTTSTQKTNQNKKGRQTKSIQECISKKEDIERVLKLLHDYIDGKNGSAICLPLLAVIRLGKMTKPTHTQIINEFGEVITKSLYNAYMKEYKFNQVELDGVTREIAQDLG